MRHTFEKVPDVLDQSVEGHDACLWRNLRLFMFSHSSRYGGTLGGSFCGQVEELAIGVRVVQLSALLHTNEWAQERDFITVLDPFKIKPGWFQLEEVGFKVIPKKRLSKTTRAKIQATIDLLALNRFRRAREKDAERYWRGDISLRTLKEDSPFVAMELRRLGRLNPGDRW